MRPWRWPVQVFTEAETAEQARRILSAALDDDFGRDGWVTDQDPIDATADAGEAERR